MAITLDEDRWLAWTDEPSDLVRFVRQFTTNRKLRLFYCACVRRVWERLIDARSKQSVEASELFADNRIDTGQLQVALSHGNAAWYEIASKSLHSAEDQAAAAAFMCDNQDLSYASGILWSAAFASGDTSKEYRAQSDLLREVIGNPFRAVVPDPRWLSSTVMLLARSIYEEKAFDRLPILADALQGSDCRNPDVLNHCHSGCLHVSGCWVVDLILGKQ